MEEDGEGRGARLVSLEQRQVTQLGGKRREPRGIKLPWRPFRFCSAAVRGSYFQVKGGKTMSVAQERHARRVDRIAGSPECVVIVSVLLDVSFDERRAGR